MQGKVIVLEEIIKICLHVSMNSNDKLIPKHGGFRDLKTFQLGQLVYDITVRFCNKFVSKYSRTHDQMVQAARSGVQNIAEGSQVSGTSKKSEIKLTNVARASQEELRLDYEDFLRQRNLPLWSYSDPRRKDAIKERFSTTKQFGSWVRKLHEEQQGEMAEIVANGVLVLLNLSCMLLDRQIAYQEKAFKEEGGITERMYRIRMDHRNGQERTKTDNNNGQQKRTKTDNENGQDTDNDNGQKPTNKRP